MAVEKKRPRGRPRGSGKDDMPDLEKVAELMVRNSTLRPTTAMKQLLKNGNRTETDQTLVRRWQSKWKMAGENLLQAARARMAPKPGSLPTHDVTATPMHRPYMHDLQSRMLGLVDPPYQRMMHEEFERVRRMRNLIDPPYQRMVREQFERAQHMRGLLDPPYMRKLREMDAFTRLSSRNHLLDDFYGATSRLKRALLGF